MSAPDPGEGAGRPGVTARPESAVSEGISPDRVLPEWLLAHARRFYAGDGVPVTPRLAATVVLLRDGASGPEAYLLRRATTMAFASGMYAFPGGSVDPADETVLFGQSTADWPALLGLPSGPARSVVCAAVRETFEESGVLLAERGGALVGDTAAWENARADLAAHRLSLADLLATHGMVPRTDLLRPLARWITPEFEPRRYDTFFFVAAVPAGQRARDLSGEADRTCWLRPADAVAAQAAGELAMLPPTVRVLDSLSGYGSVAEVLAVPARRVGAVTPRVVFDGDAARFVLPGEPG